jgi:AcrR family transcriptional regulator
MARTGRRPGNENTRESILEAARKAFGERGYAGASIRYIATSAGVDAALVHHYFGNKDQLFLAAMQAPLDPGAVLPAVFAGGLDGIGERLIRTLLTIWDSPAGSSFAAMVRSALQHEWMARMLREFFLSQIVRRIIKHLDIDPAEAPVRASLVASQIVGLAVARYMLKIEPLASLPNEMIIKKVGATVQRYLTEPLD